MYPQLKPVVCVCVFSCCVQYYQTISELDSVKHILENLTTILQQSMKILPEE